MNETGNLSRARATVAIESEECGIPSSPSRKSMKSNRAIRQRRPQRDDVQQLDAADEAKRKEEICSRDNCLLRRDKSAVVINSSRHARASRELFTSSLHQDLLENLAIYELINHCSLRPLDQSISIRLHCIDLVLPFW